MSQPPMFSNPPPPIVSSGQVNQWALKPEAHEQLPMRLVDWRNLKEEVGRCRKPRVWVGRIATSALGAAGTSLLAALALTSQDVTAAGWEWLEPTFYVVSGAALIIAIVCFILDWKVGDEFEHDVKQVEKRMTEIEGMFIQRLVSTSALKITLARFGMGHQWMDVTQALRARVQDGRLDATATLAVMGGDPAPGIVKELVVDYELGGQPDRRIFKEDERVLLP